MYLYLYCEGGLCLRLRGTATVFSAVTALHSSPGVEAPLDTGVWEQKLRFAAPQCWLALLRRAQTSPEAVTSFVRMLPREMSGSPEDGCLFGRFPEVMAVRHERAWEVLVVDDDPDIRELLAEFFRSRDVSCATAHDGRAATKALEQSGGRFGLVLTDIAMPGADGFAVLAAARIANPHCYVVIVTGYAALDTAIQAVRAGAQDYLAKPFALGQLDVIVNRAATWLATHVDQAKAARRDHDALAEVAARLAAMEARLEGIESSLAKVVALVAADAHRAD